MTLGISYDALQKIALHPNSGFAYTTSRPPLRGAIYLVVSSSPHDVTQPPQSSLETPVMRLATLFFSLIMAWGVICAPQTASASTRDSISHTGRWIHVTERIAVNGRGRPDGAAYETQYIHRQKKAFRKHAKPMIIKLDRAFGVARRELAWLRTWISPMGKASASPDDLVVVSQPFEGARIVCRGEVFSVDTFEMRTKREANEVMELALQIWMERWWLTVCPFSPIDKAEMKERLDALREATSEEEAQQSFLMMEGLARPLHEGAITSIAAANEAARPAALRMLAVLPDPDVDLFVSHLDGPPAVRAVAIATLLTLPKGIESLRARGLLEQAL